MVEVPFVLNVKRLLRMGNILKVYTRLSISVFRLETLRDDMTTLPITHTSENFVSNLHSEEVEVWNLYEDGPDMYMCGSF